MNDLISRKAAIKAIRKDMYADKDFMSAMICEGIEYMLNSVPSAEPERKKGKWKEEKDAAWSGGGCVRCSVCGYGYSFGAYHEPDEFDFCPNCGADMRGGENATD